MKSGSSRYLISRSRDADCLGLSPSQDHSCDVLQMYCGLELSDAKRLRSLEDENAKLKKLLAEAMLDIAVFGPVSNFVCGQAVEHYAAMALMKRSPKMTANWALAMVHSRGGIFHSFSDRFKIR
jgi:hypothetical protein